MTSSINLKLNLIIFKKSISGLDPEKDIERINHFKNKLNNDIKRFAQNRES